MRLVYYVVVLSSIVLTGCVPQMKTTYSFAPPQGGDGRACILQCDNGKLQCQRIADLDRQRCLEREENDYRRCEDRNEYNSKGKKKSCYRGYCAAADYKRCDSSYRSCYETCGGKVTSKTVCVSNCEKLGQ